MDPDKVYLARYDEYVGVGDTLQKAYEDLKESITRIEDENEIVFYKGTQIKVAHQFVKVTDYEPLT